MKVKHDLDKEGTLKHFMNQYNTLALLHFHINLRIIITKQSKIKNAFPKA